MNVYQRTTKLDGGCWRTHLSAVMHDRYVGALVALTILFAPSVVRWGLREPTPWWAWFFVLCGAALVCSLVLLIVLMLWAYFKDRGDRAYAARVRVS